MDLATTISGVLMNSEHTLLPVSDTFEFKLADMKEEELSIQKLLGNEYIVSYDLENIEKVETSKTKGFFQNLKAIMRSFFQSSSSVEAKKFFLLERNPASIDYGFYKDSDLIGK